MRQLFSLPRAGTAPRTPRAAAMRAENELLYGSLISGRPTDKPSLEGLLQQAKASQAASNANPMEAAKQLAGQIAQIFALDGFNRFLKTVGSVALYTRHIPACALASRIPYLSVGRDQRTALAALFRLAADLRPHQKSLLFAALTPAACTSTAHSEDTATHNKLYRALPEEEQIRVRNAIAAMQMFTRPDRLETEFLRVPEADRARFADSRIHEQIETLPPDHRFEPLSALIELRQHIHRPDILIQFLSHLYRAATQLPSDHFFAFIMRMSYMGHLSPSQTELNFQHLLTAIKDMTNDRFRFVLEQVLNPGDVPLSLQQAYVLRLLADAAIRAREFGGRPVTGSARR